MDRNLYRGQEVKEVYDEIWQTVEDEHLFYDQVIIIIIIIIILINNYNNNNYYYITSL